MAGQDEDKKTEEKLSSTTNKLRFMQRAHETEALHEIYTHSYEREPVKQNFMMVIFISADNQQIPQSS